MALSSKIVTANTALAAALLVGLIVVSFVAIVELAPKREFADRMAKPLPTHVTTPRTWRPTAQLPADRPPDPELCALTADQIFRHYEPLVAGERVEFHQAGIAGLLTAYGDLRCANAIHEGDWHLTAQILGVGLIYEALRLTMPEQEWDRRAYGLWGLAAYQFDVLSPEAMCDQALRQQDAPNAFTPLVPMCLEEFRAASRGED